MEEFFAAVRKGNLEFFIDLLDMELTNVMQGQEITTAQRFVKTWIAERDYPFSIIQLEHLRIVYIVLTDDRISQRDFMKKSERCGLQRDRRRPHNAGRNATAIRGVVTNWQMDDIRYHEIVQKYFSEADKKLLPAAES